MSKFNKDYPKWKGITKNLDFIFNELINNWIEVYDLDIELTEKNYFKELRNEK